MTSRTVAVPWWVLLAGGAALVSAIATAVVLFLVLIGFAGCH